MLMRTITILIFLFFGVFKAQSENIFERENQVIDTLSVMNLKNKIYKKNKVQILHLGTLDKTEEEYQMKLQVLINKRVLSNILLPYPDSGLGNFKLSSIEETKKGFLIRSQSGRGDLVLKTVLFLIYRNNNFYLEKVEVINYKPSRDYTKSGIMNVVPPVPIKELVIDDYS